MKLKLLFSFLLAMSMGLRAQSTKAKTTSTAYPAAFTISKAEYDQLFAAKVNTLISDKKNKYLDKAMLQMSTASGDMRFLKLKLSYFKNAFLLVQVNGSYSTQVFILSDDKSVFYKGNFEKGNVVMSKCSEDDIVSE